MLRLQKMAHLRRMAGTARQTAMPAALLLAALAALPWNGLRAADPDQILGCMERAGEENRALTQAYTSARIYRAENVKLHKAGTVSVEVIYTPPGQKDYRIVSKTGSGIVHKRVMEPALEEERRNAPPASRVHTDIHRRNYDFAFLEFDAEAGANVFQAAPKAPDKRLFKGKVWIDEATCAVLRIEGEPAVSPSFWVKKTQFRHDYARVEGVWLPVRHHTEVQLRLFGRSTFDIEYVRYSFGAPTETATWIPPAAAAE